MEFLLKKLEASRLELLDMGLRGNSLLHFRMGAKNIDVIDEKSSEIYKILCVDQKVMSLAPVPDNLLNEFGKVENVALLPTQFEKMYGAKRHIDTQLQTKLPSTDLDKKLLKISTEAETFCQEQGVDILYLAIGFLNWYEDKNSEKLRNAPLILIPVSLDRTTVKDRFKISYTQVDLGPNLTLSSKLKMDYNIVLPTFDEDLDIEKYLSDVEQSIKKEERWKVDKNRIALGFFSFSKFQMYQDLDPDGWPEGKKPYDNAVFRKLLIEGFETSNQSDHSPQETDYVGTNIELTRVHFVKDADSSQTEAVMAVKQGKNLVIQGPPGTGKSQTITNIISESLSDEKTVLFVAEKMAALEVVKKRLDESHLGDAVLELHSHKSNKKIVLEELKRTLELGLPDVKDRTQEKERHVNLRKHLDEYCEHVNEPILKSGINYIDALGHQLRLKSEFGDNEIPTLSFLPMRDWTDKDFGNVCNLVNEVVSHLYIMGVPAFHTFVGSKISSFSPTVKDNLLGVINRSKASIAECKNLCNELSNEMNIDCPTNIQKIKKLLNTLRIVTEAPDLTGVNLLSDDWFNNKDKVENYIETYVEMRNLKTKYESILIDQAWEMDLLNLREIWSTTGKTWWRFLFSSFRKAKKSLQGIMKVDLPANAEECIQIIDDVLLFQSLQRKVEIDKEYGVELFGTRWNGLQSNLPVLKDLSLWMFNVCKNVADSMIDSNTLLILKSGVMPHWKKSLGELEVKVGESERLIEEVYSELVVPVIEAEKEGIEYQDLDSLDELFDKWRTSLDDIYQIVRYNSLSKQLTDKGLTDLDELAFQWEKPFDLLFIAFQITWYSGLINICYEQRSSLAAFDRIGHENKIKEFKKLDEDLFFHAQEALILGHHENLPAMSGAGEMGILRREMHKKRRHMAIRKLLIQAGRAIQQVKPIFMMSPMSVATYLAQEAIDFDLVVFDEASQVKVVDAFGPILRGKQVVVVGDTKQMPPTSFFGKSLELDDEEAEDSQTADIESILSMFLSQGARESMLRWHYRSRHDSLIAVSNQEFYDGRLMIFPSPGVNPSAKGLSFNHLPDTIYERGGSRTNPLEARFVAEAVMKHAHETPDLTLGVVAFSTAQRDCILLEVDRLRRQDPICESFFISSTLEGFFVKNLENVQGDERDVIFISIGYGRTSTGKITKSFGPINRVGGERRLNVLITRARLSMEVFCNFTADDMVTKSDSPFGVRALKSFLKYAESNILENSLETGKDTDSPFEDEVISAIRQLGYQIEPQVGSAGFYIDIAVRDPKKPGRYILAVECDGASYHSSASARDRDRLRQSVLEGIGWRFHRVWSTDWFRNSYKEIERLKLSIEKSIQYYEEFETRKYESVTKISEVSQSPKSIDRVDVKVGDDLQADYYTMVSNQVDFSNYLEIYEVPEHILSIKVGTVLEVEGPIHVKEVARRLAEALCIDRVGAKFLKHVMKGVMYGHNSKSFYFENDFIYSDNKKEVKIRDRSKLESTYKKIDMVPKKEIKAAILLAIESSFSLSEQDAISEALSMMGFQRSTKKAKGIVEEILKFLLKNNELKRDRMNIVLAT